MQATTSRQACGQTQRCAPAAGSRVAQRPVIRCANSVRDVDVVVTASRRDALLSSATMALVSCVGARPAIAAGGIADPPTPPARVCDDACVANLESLELVTTPSGLQYRDITVGKGPSPPVGFQVVVHYDARTPNGRVFDSSVEKGKPYDIRVGSGQVIPGLDEGLLTMKPGGIRRMYIPGDLAFPKGLKAAPGRPAVPPSSPVVFDVQLLYIPGLEDEDEF